MTHDLKNPTTASLVHSAFHAVAASAVTGLMLLIGADPFVSVLTGTVGGAAVSEGIVDGLLRKQNPLRNRDSLRDFVDWQAPWPVYFGLIGNWEAALPTALILVAVFYERFGFWKKAA